MNLLQFFKRFPDEQSCKEHLKQIRLDEGIVCDGKCKCVTKHYYLKNIEKFQCMMCNSRTNLKSRTMMERSQLPLQTWFMCIHLMTTTKKPISCLEMKRQLDISKYESVSKMMNTIRQYMGNRDNRYKLKGEIELDDAFFEVVDLPLPKDELGNEISTDNSIALKSFTKKRGRGSQGKQKVLVMVESEPVGKSLKYNKDRKMGFVKMVVIDEVTNISVNYEIQKLVDPSSRIISDNWKGFSRLTDVVKNHTPETVKPIEAMKKLPWVHTVISNCKRELLGIHHSITRDYLQTYLNEFCYKLNRRNFTTDLFDRMILSSLSK